MKKRSNALRSGAAKTSSLSLNDLITHSEQTISSQASVYTNDSKKSQPFFSQVSTNSQDFQDYDDIIGEDIDTLFITPEEEKKIQNILQFARKGKINPANAFEIPVRVIDPQITETTNMRFWKFASQLLYASMSIYDKRVQNMYQNTNRMFDNLVRVQGQPNQPLTDEEVEEKQRRQRGELIRMEVGEIGKTEGVSSYEIGSVNCEEGDKINIKSVRHQFLPDPLFGRRLQAFDSNSLKSLFMNAFECGADTQIVFFNSCPKEQVKVEDIKMEVKQEEEEMDDYEERVPKFVSRQIQNIGSLQRIQKIGCFQIISQFKMVNVKESIQNTRNQVRDFTSDLLQFNKQMKEMQEGDILQSLNYSTISETQSLTQAGDNSFNFQFNAPDNTQLSEQIRFQSQSKPLSYAFSSQNANQSPFYTEDIYQNNSQMTPWQLQFKGLKLQRRKNVKKSTPREQIKQKKVRTQSTLQLDFLDGNVETRSKVFKITKSRNDHSDQPIDDRNLLPKQMNPYTDAYKQRRTQERNDFAASLKLQNSARKLASNQLPQNIKQQQFAFQPEENIQHQSFNIQSITQTTANNFQSNLFHEQHQTQGMMYRSSGIRNIREIKQKIYRHIENGRSIRLSSLNINLHPSSILIIFLHLVNENNLLIESIDDETDIEICLRSP